MYDWKDILNETIQERIEYYGNTNIRIVEHLQKIIGMIESGEEIDSAIKNMCDKYGLAVDKNNKRAGNLSCLTLARKIFEKGAEDREYFEWVLELLHKARWNELAQSHCHRIINSLYEIRKSLYEDNEFVQRKLVSYLQKSTPDELLINATVKYPQFKDESKKIKLFLIDVINSDEPINNLIDSWDKFTA